MRFAWEDGISPSRRQPRANPPPKDKAGVDDGGVKLTYRVGCGEAGERHRGGGWLMGSRGSDCAKGVVSGRWVVAGEGVEVSGGGFFIEG
jgi:hypothetical protein